MFCYVATVATASIRHDYYQIITIPAVSLCLGSGALFLLENKIFNRFLSRLLLSLSILLMFLSSVYVIKEFYKINHPEIVKAGQEVDKILPKDAMVIAPYNGDTAFLYQTGRFGWPVMEFPVDELIQKGASYYISVNYDSDTNDVLSRFEVIEKNPDFVIVDLKKPIKK